MPRSPRRKAAPPPGKDDAVEPGDLRVIGGTLRGRKIAHAGHERSGALVTRPMKHRVREAVFNLLGPAVEGRHALDLFAGTGALGIEALSRGARGATFIERHVPTAAALRDNLAALGLEATSTIHTTSAFLWARRDLPQAAPELGPWVAFVSPPYAFYRERLEEVLALVQQLLNHSAPGSILVVEADTTFDFSQLPLRHSDAPPTEEPPSVGPRTEDLGPLEWDVRAYPPAVIAVLRTPD